MSGVAGALDAVTSDIPLKEAVRYKKGNLKWTRSDVKKHTEALACGLLELGCKATFPFPPPTPELHQPGDTVAVWLPECSEKHIAQLAAARVGMVVAEVDPTLTSADAVGKVLEESGATVVLLEDKMISSLSEAVPELRHYSTSSGLPFRSARFPALRLCLHTGFDREPALHNFRSVLLYQPSPSPLTLVDGKVKGNLPLFTEYTAGKGGVPIKGATLSQNEVLETGKWETVGAILSKTYTEV
ncbi:unnamed protein product [Choristocarpus tenellus]